MKENSSQDLTRKNARTGLIVLAVVVGMIALSFASVPLYNLFCRVTGFGGTTQTAAAFPDDVLDRQITVQFNADTSRDLPWKFAPEQKQVVVSIGGRGLTAFTAENLRNEPTGGTALYNVTPLKVGKYFHKVQCFCFDEQILEPGQKVSMPVLFYIDPAIADDPNMDDVTTITLSYSFYPLGSKALEEALEAFYNGEEETMAEAPDDTLPTQN